MKTTNIPEGDVGLFFLETGEVLLSGYNLHRFLGEEEKLCQVFEFAVNILRPIPSGVWGIIKTGPNVIVYADRRCPWVGRSYQVDVRGETCHISCFTPTFPSRLAAAISWSAPSPQLDINPDIIQVGCYVGRVLVRAAAMVCNHIYATVEWNALWEKFYDLALSDPLLGRVDYLKVPETEYARWLGYLGFNVLPPKPGDPVQSVLYTRKWWERIRMPVL